MAKIPRYFPKLAILCCFTVSFLWFALDNLIPSSLNSMKRCAYDTVYREYAGVMPQYIQRGNRSSKYQFKMDGVVYDCLSRAKMWSYNPEDVAKKSKPLQTLTIGEGEDPAARKSSFVEIFDKQVWGGKEEGVVDKTSEQFKASGPGSKLTNTMGCMALLHTIVETLKVHLNKDVISIADVPCGDLQWMSHFLTTRSDVQYTGIDIVPTLIKRHTDTYKNNPRVNFINTDVVQNPLNQSFDVIFSRQMMQHFKNSDITRVLSHFSESGTKYMIATTYSDLAKNRELVSTANVRFRTMNLEKPPYSLVPPVCSYREPTSPDNYLSLWELPLRTLT